MKKFIPFIPVAAFILLMAGGCKKEQDIDPTDPVPRILSVSITPNTVTEFEDSLVFLVEYQDGDGDLGENTPDARNLFLVDNRINITEQYRIQSLAPDGAEISIHGFLEVVLPSTGITDGSNSQSFNYTLYVRDRAGHESAHYITDLITVVR